MRPVPFLPALVLIVGCASLAAAVVLIDTHSYIAELSVSPTTQTAEVFSSGGTSYTWNTLKVGAGGWLVGMDIAPDGTKVVRADTYGAYVWDASINQWRELITTSSMPAADVYPGAGSGVYEIKIAPSNTNRFYMMYEGRMYRSDDRGAHWTKTSFSQVTLSSNDNYRMNGQKMAVDPANPDIVYAGTAQDGVWVTQNAGATWSRVTAVPTSVAVNGAYPGHSGIAFDPSGGTTGGKTSVIYLPSWGNGIWRSTDAGVTWTQISGGSLGGPTQIEHSAVGGGTYYAMDLVASPDNGWKYSGSAWTNMKGSGNQSVAIAVDPQNPLHLVAATGGSTLNQSVDGGATWKGYIWGTYPHIATDIPWLAWTNENYMSIGDIAFDPQVPNKIWNAEGIGVWYTMLLPTQTSVVTFTSQSAGIEQLVANEIVVPPGGKPLLASWDRPVFYSANQDIYPSVHGPNRTNSIVMGWGVDYASSNPSYIAGFFNWGTEQSGYSTDGGQTWTPFASYPPDSISKPNGVLGGSIAASTPQNLIWMPSDNGAPYYTLDGGATWNIISIAGLPTTGELGWGWAYYLKRYPVAADRVTANTFYMYNYGPTGAASGAGIYKSTDGGATWTHVYTGSVAAFPGYHAKLKSVPGEAGNLFFTSGTQGSASGTHPAGVKFMRSTDGGTTWTAVSNVLEVLDFGFGRPAHDGDYPTIFIAGWVNNVWGIWQSDDNAASWTKVGDYPLGSLDSIVTVAGDPNIYGRVYIGFGGSGYAYGQMNGVSTNPPPPPAVTVTPTPTPTPTTPSTPTVTTPNSNSNSVSTTPSVFLLSIPTGVSARSIDSGSVALSWNTSPDPGVVGYKLYRGGSVVDSITGTTYTVTGLQGNTTYAFDIASYNSDGQLSPRASVVVTTPPGVAKAYTQVTLPSAPSASTTSAAASVGASASSPLTSALSVGSSGRSVAMLQTFLIAKNYLAPQTSLGYYGNLTANAVAQFQREQGIISSGTPATTGFGAVGPKTRAALNTAITSDAAVAAQVNAAVPTPSSASVSAPSTPSARPAATPAPTKTVTPPASIAAPACKTLPPATTPGNAILTLDLSLGVCSTEVLTLQEILNTLGYTVADSGPGSRHNETVRFDANTQAAVIKFQKDKGITGDASGTVGPATRAALLQLY